MSTRRVPIVCLPCGKPGTLHGPAVTLKLAPKRPAPLTTGVALNEVAWKDDKGEEVECTICAYPMSADSEANPWTGPGLFLTQACVNGHVYHKGCLLTHMSRSNNINAATCPECRNPILSEVAASLRRNGAPAPVPAPAPAQGGGGGGLFGGGGGLFGGGNAPAPAPAPGGDPNNPFGSGGGLFGPPPELVRQTEEAERQERRRLNNDDAASLWERIHGGGDLPPPPPFGRTPTLSDEEASRRAAERRRMESEERRAAQLPYRSLAPLPEMTGVNGYFFLVGGLRNNPTPLEIKEALRYRVQDEPLYADRLHIRMSEQNLNPFHGGSESGGMRVTLVQYEFNGLTDEEGDTFVGYYLDMVGVPDGLGRFYQEFFDLPTTPMVGVNGAPKWGEDPLGRPPTLQITPDEYDAWARQARAEREALEVEREELQRMVRMAEQRAEANQGPRTRARAAAEMEAAASVPAEEREQLDDF
mgnify:CR=1 FL=1